MTQGTDHEATNRLVLIHLEPETYQDLPPERDAQLLLELVTAALTYREVLIKDTDLILNDRVIRALQGPSQSFELFAQLISQGLVKILLRPHDHDYANTGLDPAVSPIMIRAHNTPFKDRPWIPEEHHKRFYAAVDNLLCRYPLGMAPVTLFPRDRNPFAQWLGDLLPQWQRIVQIPDFKGINAEIASIFTQLCQEEGTWFKFLKEKNPKAVSPGDEDRPLSRSPIYRCLAAFEGEHKGFKHLVQSIYNACYCHAERAAGTFLDGHLVEPPGLLASTEEQLVNEQFHHLELIGLASTNIPITPEIAEALLETRQSVAWETLQQLLSEMKRGSVSKITATRTLKDLAGEFGRNCERLTHRSVDARLWNVAWTMVTGAAEIAGFHYRPVEMRIIAAASGCATVAPSALDWIRSQVRVRTIRKSIVDAFRFRRSHIIVPKHIDWLAASRNP
ncbi:MAG: hypothetical protein C3F12_04590 [Candidatus Methylomirabilota bacterium]|nr:hypothetical protein [Candidatus Methylomirabilis sp.]NJD69715.1 hypothetical protein [candidate division NC10 bacterium]PWB47259.1 MAG: hypothetical protein C3F12_04590 [candidate division NC10 bacterium]